MIPADLIHKTAEAAADWWAARLMQGDRDKFHAHLVDAVDKGLRAQGILELSCDYDPQGVLLDAVRAAGVACRGSWFSAEGILPQKHDLIVSPGLLDPKEGYANWTASIEVLP